MKRPTGEPRAMAIKTLYRRALERLAMQSAGSGWEEDAGFGLVEVIVALVLLAIAVTFLSGGLTSSLLSTAQSQNRMGAAEVASQTLQEVENLGYSTVVEGISCPPPAPGQPCTTLAQPDPNKMLQYDSTNSCWYYGSHSNGLLVPTSPSAPSDNSHTPIIPYVSSPNGYGNPVVNGVSYLVTSYPMINTKQYPNVNCANLTNESGPDVPVTVVVEVTWGNPLQRLSMQTVLYSPPPVQPVPANPNTCPVNSPLQGAHLESHLASPSSTSGTGVPATASPGGTASIFFLDEAPTPYLPTFCVVDSSGIAETVNISITQYYYGNTSSNPFLPTSRIVAVNPSFAGSGPNAASPPSGGGYCKTPYAQGATIPTTCNVEIQWTFTLPSVAPSGLSYNSITIAGWDHEGDLDYFTWKT